MALVNEQQQHPGRRWMLEALKLAQNALDKQEVPGKINLVFFDMIIFFDITQIKLFSWLCNCS